MEFTPSADLKSLKNSLIITLHGEKSKVLGAFIAFPLAL